MRWQRSSFSLLSFSLLRVIRDEVTAHFFIEVSVRWNEGTSEPDQHWTAWPLGVARSERFTHLQSPASEIWQSLLTDEEREWSAPCYIQPEVFFFFFSNSALAGHAKIVVYFNLRRWHYLTPWIYLHVSFRLDPEPLRSDQLSLLAWACRRPLWWREYFVFPKAFPFRLSKKGPNAKRKTCLVTWAPEICMCSWVTCITFMVHTKQPVELNCASERFFRLRNPDVTFPLTWRLIHPDSTTMLNLQASSCAAKHQWTGIELGTLSSS